MRQEHETDALSAPLVPAEVDLRGYQYMPLDVARLRDSRVGLLDDAEAFRAAVFSWCSAWHQVPAASLPDDDAELCRLLGYGRDLKKWLKLRKGGALHGWVKCSDGRLYHPVVAEKAIEGWEKKREQKERTRRATEERTRRTRDDKRSVDRNDIRDGERSGVRDGSAASQRNVHQGNGEERNGEEQEKKEVAASAATTNGHSADTTYAFQGKIIKLNQQDFDRWKQAYPNIPDLTAALTKADDYYREHPPAGGKWFHAVSRWLEKDNADAKKTAREGRRGEDFW